MKRKIISILILILLLGSMIQTAAAASLRFQVPRSVVTVFINSNGTATIEYYYDFTNSPSGISIDPIDIGLPNNDYDLNSVSGEINGLRITNIERLDSSTPGVTVWLGNNAIRPGATGKVHVRIGTLRNLFYEGTAKEKEPYASMQFEPNFFGSEYVSGSTDMTVVFFFPKEIGSDEPRYYPTEGWPGNSKPETGVDQNGFPYYKWNSTGANSYSTYKFGASFPGRLIPASAIQKTPLISLTEDELIGYGVCGCFALFFGISIYGGTIGAQKRKLQYLPPKISIEGMGIKRGLTAVEAAILMEQPMDKILTMILFSTIKKGAATVTSKEPLKLEVSAAAIEGLNQYEIDFLSAMKSANLNDRRRDMQAMMVALVKSITEKMKGFSRKETIAYYKDIMTKAWEQVEAAQTPEVQMQKFDEQLDWTMLDGNFNDRTRNVFRNRPVYVPMWWGRYDPGYHGSGMSSSVGPTGGSGRTINIPAPNLPGADFASSIVNGVSSFASSAVGDMTGFTGGVTNKTNPVPISTSSGGSSGGGGGRSCACACACAGCACACAGGGR